MTSRFPPRSRKCLIADQESSGNADPNGSTRSRAEGSAKAAESWLALATVDPGKIAAEVDGTDESAAGNPASLNTTVLAPVVWAKSEAIVVESNRKATANNTN